MSLRPYSDALKDLSARWQNTRSVGSMLDELEAIS